LRFVDVETFDGCKSRPRALVSEVRASPLDPGVVELSTAMFWSRLFEPVLMSVFDSKEVRLEELGRARSAAGVVIESNLSILA
jgi:hypothetical protein